MNLINGSEALNSIKTKVQKILWYLGKNAFFFILVFILLDILFAQAIFYIYINSIEKDIQTNFLPTQFKKDTYEYVLNQWKVRNSIFEGVDNENYPDPFK